MKASFKCGVCGERLTLTGTPDGIERARVMWLKGHEHPVAILTTGSTLTAAPVDFTLTVGAECPRPVTQIIDLITTHAAQHRANVAHTDL